MKGYAGLLLLCLGIVASGCLNIKLKQELSLDEADWSAEGASLLRTHEAHSRVDPPLIEMWRYDAGAGIGPGGALIADSVVIFGTRKGMIHALNLADGQRRGRKRFDAPVEAAMTLDEHVLYVPLGLDKKSIVAWDIVDGAKKWVLKGKPIEAGLLDVDSTIYAVDVDAEVMAIHKRDGHIIWQKTLDEHVTVLASPIAIGSTLIVIHEQGGIYGLDRATGSQKWQRDLGAPVYNSPSSDEELIYVPTTRGKLLALDAQTGDTRWVYELDDSSVRFSAPAIASDIGHVIVGATDNMIRALNTADGSLLWDSDVEAATNTPPLVTKNTIYVGTLRSKLFALDKKTGVSIWSHELTGRVKSALTAYDGRLVVMAETQQVIMFAPDTSATAGL